MKTRCYKIQVEECDSGNTPFTFYFDTHDDLNRIIDRLEAKNNFTPEIAMIFGTGLKMFSEAVRKNAAKEPFASIEPLLNSIMKIVKNPE